MTGWRNGPFPVPISVILNKLQNSLSQDELLSVWIFFLHTHFAISVSLKHLKQGIGTVLTYLGHLSPMSVKTGLWQPTHGIWASGSIMAFGANTNGLSVSTTSPGERSREATRYRPSSSHVSTCVAGMFYIFFMVCELWFLLRNVFMTYRCSSQIWYTSNAN